MRMKGGKEEGSHLHQKNVLRALSLHLRVLDLHGHRPPVTQHGLVDLGQGGCPQRGVIKAQEQIMNLSREEKRGQGSYEDSTHLEGRKEDGPGPPPAVANASMTDFSSLSCFAWVLCSHGNSHTPVLTQEVRQKTHVEDMTHLCLETQLIST